MVGVGQDVLAGAGQGPCRSLDLFEPVRDGLFLGAGEPLHQLPPQACLLGPVGLDEALVDALDGLERGVAIISEEVLQVLGLGVGEQVVAGQ